VVGLICKNGIPDFIMNPDYCTCNEFEKAVDYNDIRYYRPEDDRFNAVKKAGWYMYSIG